MRIGDCDTNVESLCDHFVDMVSLVKNQVENDLDRLFNFWGQNIDVSDQDNLVLLYMGIHDEERNKTNTSDQLTESRRR